MLRKRPPRTDGSNVVKFRRPAAGRSNWTRPEAYGVPPSRGPGLAARAGAVLTGWRPLALLVAAITLYALWRDGWLG